MSEESKSDAPAEKTSDAPAEKTSDAPSEKTSDAPADGPRTRRARRIGIGMVVLAAFMWGCWPLLLRFSDRVGGGVPAAVQAEILMVTLTIVSFAFVPFDRRVAPVPRTRAHWLGVMALGVGDALNALCLFYAYKVASVAVAVLTHDTGPLLVALAAPLALGERVRRATFGAIGLALFGLVLMLRPWEVAATHAEIIGAGVGLASAVFYAGNVLLNKRLVGAFSGSELMAWHGVFGIPVLLLVTGIDAWTHVKPVAIGVLAIAAIGPGAMGGLLFSWGVRRVQASLAATVALLEPVVAIVLSVLLLGEHLTMLRLAGALLVLAGAVIVARR